MSSPAQVVKMAAAVDKNTSQYTQDIRLVPGEELVCYCSQVSKAEILAAVKAGAKTLQAIKDATGACTVACCKETSPRGR